MRRLQIFLNGWAAQCNRHRVLSELILVEWNPLPDRPKLAQALEWPADLSYCTPRIIEVPPEVHDRFRHGASLPLYQMIAKNAGIRRARGEFILATNIDILFNDELMSLFAGRRLRPGRMYRMDRHDAMADVPLEAGVDEQMEYCRSHLLRVNKREGTFSLTPEGYRKPECVDVIPADAGIVCDRGWYGVEGAPGPVWRWLSTDAELLLTRPPAPGQALAIDLEPGAGTAYQPFRLQLFHEQGDRLDEVTVKEREEVALRLPASLEVPCRVRLHVEGGGIPVAHDPRLLNAQIFGIRWERPDVLARVRAESLKRRTRWQARQFLRKQLSTWLPALRLHQPPPVPPAPAAESAPLPEQKPLAMLHTNACGDFTLLHRDHWLDLRGYAEFDAYSMNIDSAFCWAAHYAGFEEEMIAEPARVYHIEHGSGSGWTPEGHNLLYDRITSKGIPWLDYQDVVDWARHMSRWRCPMIFNRDNWGLADAELPETVVTSRLAPGESLPASRT